ASSTSTCCVASHVLRGTILLCIRSTNGPEATKKTKRATATLVSHATRRFAWQREQREPNRVLFVVLTTTTSVAVQHKSHQPNKATYLRTLQTHVSRTYVVQHEAHPTRPLAVSNRSPRNYTEQRTATRRGKKEAAKTK
ncbi:unnamed protein product, partial [Ectocarpus sp. 8 AP-2014]